MPEPTDKAVDALAKAMWSAYPRHRSWAFVEDEQRQQITATATRLLGAVYPQIVADVLDHYADRAMDEGTTVTEGWLRDFADEVRP